MSDKENAEKENEQFSSSILYVATAVYVSVCAMVFGALYARHQSVGDAFLKLMADYGTILAGIPVLVAVVVAKQQLDANRRQHVATVKRSFQKELDALYEIEYFASEARSSSIETASKRALFEGMEGLIIDCPSKRQLKKYRAIVPYDIADIAERISQETYDLYKASISEDRDENIIELRLDEIKTSSAVLVMLIRERHNQIEKYWS